MDEPLKLRIKWSLFDYYSPIRFRIADWKHLKILKRGYGQYMLVDSTMEYKGRLIELCVPYKLFVYKLLAMPIIHQKKIITGEWAIELTKTYRHEKGGMIVKVVQE